MAQSLKTKYLLMALGVSAVLCLLVGGFAYYEHRVDTADINQLTYTAVEQKLEADLEARADSLSKITVGLLAPALSSGNKAAVGAIAQRLLEERDIERVEVKDGRGVVLFTGSNASSEAQGRGPFMLQSAIRGSGTLAALHGGTLQVWSRRGEGTNFVLTLPRGAPEGDLGHPVPMVPADATPDRPEPRKRHVRRSMRVGS